MRMIKRCMVLAAALLLLAGACSCAKKQESLEELLKLGQKYLTEENYEEAVVVFEKAIAADEKCVEAYAGLADAYKGRGDTSKAVEILEKGYGLTQDESLLEKREVFAPQGADAEGQTGGEDSADGTETGDGTYGPGELPVRLGPDTKLEELRSLIESGEYALAGELASSEDVLRLVREAGSPAVLPVSGDPIGGSGTGLGVYQIAADWYATYLGDYIDGKRSGHGIWVFSPEAYFEGVWLDDAPNGEGKIVTHAYGESKAGNFVDGKYDGTILSAYAEGADCQILFDNGFPVIQGHLSPDVVEPDNPYTYIISVDDNEFMCSREQSEMVWGVPGFTPEIMY